MRKILYIYLFSFLFLVINSPTIAESVKVSDFSHRILKTEHSPSGGKWITISWKMDIENPSKRFIEGFVGFIFLDKDGFELEIKDGKILELGPSEQRTLTGTLTVKDYYFKEAKQVNYFFKEY